MQGTTKKSAALKFVLTIGILSFFADFTYEGARSVYGPFLALLSASATIVGIVAGLSELAGYGLRLVSGRWADRRASAYGLFTAGYGVCWFIGSTIMGMLYDWSVTATIIFCVATQLAAVPMFFIVRRQYGAFRKNR